MLRRATPVAFFIATAAVLLGAGCSRRPDPAPAAAGNGQAHEPAPAAPTNRVDVPPAVRQNLGITFAKVERRPVAQTVRVPGRFELLPDARREYRTMLAGRLELAVNQFDRVEEGTVLYRLHSPAWRELQREIAEAEAAIRTAVAASETIGPLREAHHLHEDALNQTVVIWSERIEQLERVRQAGGGKAEDLAQARATLAAARAELAEVMERDAELEAREREIAATLRSARSRVELLLSSASTLLGIPVAELTAEGGNGEPGPLWRRIDVVEVRATSPGIVESFALSNGAWADASSLVLTTVQPERVRFRAKGLQSDLGRLRDGLAASVAPPGGVGGAGEAGVMRGELAIGLAADPDDRTVDLYMTPREVSAWARPGVSALMEITLAGGRPELAVPLACITRDGLTPVMFRRDPRNPDVVIRIDADLGVDDGKWVEVRSGVREGDEVVLDGVYQLMLATSETERKGGHFHADGTFHAEDH